MTGHWYGYVAPADVPALLYNHIVHREIVDNLWKCQVCFSKEQQRLSSMTVQFDLNSSPVPETRAEMEVPPPPPSPTSEAVTNQNNSVLQPSNGATDPRIVLTPQIETKLLVPREYDGDVILNGYELHHFSRAKEVKAVVDKTTKWISGKLSLALMKNGNVFAVQAKDVSDFLFQETGALCVVDNDQLPLVVTTRSLYTTSTTATLSERKPDRSTVSDIHIIKTEFGGNRLMRRQYSIEGDNSYNVLQWVPQASDTESKLKPLAKGKQSEELVVVEQRKEDQAERAVTDTVDDFSIKNCITIANTIQELSVDEKARACDIFKNDQNRAIFVCADPATRLVWLRR